MKRKVVIGVGMLVVGAVGWWGWRGRGDRGEGAERDRSVDAARAAGAGASSSTGRASGATVDRRAAVDRARLPLIVRGAAAGAVAGGGSTEAAPPGRRGAIDFGPAWSTLPPSYRVEVLDVDAVAIALRGETGAWGRVATRAGQAAPALAELRGRVLEGGAPAAGVVVVVGDRLTMIGGLRGQAAATTDADGRFRVRAPVTARIALALGPRSWSALTPIVPGDELALELGPAAGLEVTVVEDGAPLPTQLSVRMGGKDFLTIVHAADGVFRFAALPPGAATLHVSAAIERATGGDLGATVAVELRPGEVVRQRIELDSRNATVAIIPTRIGDQPPTAIEYTLLAPPEPTTLADLRARAGAMPLLGGADAASTYQMQRVTPAGPRVACAVARFAAPADDAAAPPPPRRWGCAPVDVPATGVVEVEVALDRPPP